MATRIHPLSRGRFRSYLANDPDQIQYAEVILSVPFGRMVQVQNNCRRLFGISVRGRSYKSAKLTSFPKFFDFRDFGHVWRAIAWPVIYSALQFLA